ncbi:unnamed protein product [Zymoseptoria tritici ST99CH_1A5]|uniref:prephenate dehydratase n=2 Tax=Zymoseptoria tritici TaxID=1047171 RepID=A0A2H1GTT9_ZYMTR|nr:unnamed protein product [Zymoseptoria tritici ST99CH_1E4]SMY27047.1 unnamed protein product [Zymoseptoria tritici ST99CH_1A5]
MAPAQGQQTAVAFLGPKASYTHQATLSVFPNSQTHALAPQVSIEDVFAAVQSSTTGTLGVVPFENSSNGSVVFTLDLFVDLHNRYPDLVVDAEIYLPVRHCLLGHQRKQRRTSRTEGPWRRSEQSSSPPSLTPVCSSSPPKSSSTGLPDLSHITKLYSHPQAWGQCKSFLSKHLHGLERQDVSSTSRAAELVAADPSGTSAAIASKIAAELISPLDVLVEGIEDNEGNSTRFFVLRKLSSSPTSTTSDIPSCDAPTNEEDYERHKTLITFTLLQHGSSGALADCLAVFKNHGINLTSINTRPSGERAWDYVFFVEFQGRRGSRRVDAALEELGEVVRGWRWLGSWKNMLFVEQENGDA